jgi:thiamine-monophosphate kinase
MSLSEFELIQRSFRACGARRSDLVLGVGDDAALLRVPPGMDLAATLDTLVSGVHFFPDADPEALGHKALAVNLSDLAAMGAEPAWVTLGLTLPAADETWVAAFACGFCSLAREAGVSLVGGDTTRGPLALSVEAKGLVPAGQALRRCGARPGDAVFVTGTLGDAGLALRLLGEGVPVEAGLRRRLERPDARLAAGTALRGLASAAIDVSDGLAADLGHILEQSGAGAEIELACLPCSAAVAAWLERTGDWALPLTAGDDYELCFTLPQERLADLHRLLPALPCPVTRIGTVTPGTALTIRAADGSAFRPSRPGWEHFHS